MEACRLAVSGHQATPEKAAIPTGATRTARPAPPRRQDGRRAGISTGVDKDAALLDKQSR
jgi:hypothetical protein